MLGLNGIECKIENLLIYRCGKVISAKVTLTLTLVVDAERGKRE